MKTKELLEAGTIGQPYHAMANYWEAVGYTTFFDEDYFFAEGNWRFDPQKAGGGILMDGATHWVRPLSMWWVHINLIAQIAKTTLYAQVGRGEGSDRYDRLSTKGQQV